MWLVLFTETNRPHNHWFVNLILSGPFWICTTLVFAIAISGNLSNFLVHLGKPDYKYTPEFRKGMCSCSLSKPNVELFFRGKNDVFVVFSSEHRCDSNLQLCLAGAPRPLGFLTLEKQQGHELSFLHLHGDRLRLWIFSCNLHPSSGMIFDLNISVHEPSWDCNIYLQHRKSKLKHIFSGRFLVNLFLSCVLSHKMFFFLMFLDLFKNFSLCLALNNFF